VYVTLNTAVLDKELKEAVAYADFLYGIGVDALIMSDLGLASLIRGRYPDMELHASTQASGHNAECAKTFAKMGFSRMVCARELSKDEIKELCTASPIEIEQFIHGAMCVSQSGQCLASAVMGGRSGNRGVCAQPCRMKYNGRYPLSLKDMCLAQHVTELIESGVASLKIEGRMKSPAYVYEVVSVYRRLLDEARNASKDEMQTLANVFSRGSFTDGRTFDSSRGKEVAFPVGGVVPGFAEALQTLPEGSKGKIYIPWQLGYGKSGNRSIPPYSVLIFDIEVMRVIKAKK
jgi:putative protease